MKLKIVTPERLVLEEDVDAVFVQTVNGELGILPQHIPLVTPLAIGLLRYEHQSQKHPVAVMGGILQTDGKQVMVLSQAAELSSDIDAARATEAQKRAESRLKQLQADVDMERAQASLSRAQVRQKVKQYASGPKTH